MLHDSCVYVCVFVCMLFMVKYNSPNGKTEAARNIKVYFLLEQFTEFRNIYLII